MIVSAAPPFYRQPKSARPTEWVSIPIAVSVDGRDSPSANPARLQPHDTLMKSERRSKALFLPLTFSDARYVSFWSGRGPFPLSPYKLFIL